MLSAVTAIGRSGSKEPKPGGPKCLEVLYRNWYCYSAGAVPQKMSQLWKLLYMWISQSSVVVVKTLHARLKSALVGERTMMGRNNRGSGGSMGKDSRNVGRVIITFCNNNRQTFPYVD